MVAKVYSRTLRKAAELCGGQKKLARYLCVPLADLEKWLAGSDAPPMSAFLKAVDFVLDETRFPTDGEGPEDEAPRDAAATSNPEP